ncbi:MAG: hypothetical protein ACLS6G_04415, partial [Christensenellales bacterium]
PGADALSAFADLLGAPPEGGADDAQAVQEADFPLPAAIPGDVGGAVELTYALDFGALCADDAELTLELVRGRGRVLADDVPLCAFQNPKDGLVRVPLAHALHAGRRQTLRLCFDASRPAGVLGPVCLRLTTRARLRDIALWPDADEDRPPPRGALRDGDGALVLRARRLRAKRCPCTICRPSDGGRTADGRNDPAPAGETVYPRSAGGWPLPPRSAPHAGAARRAL